MEVKIRPSHKNHYPLQGFLLNNPSVPYWAQELQRMNLSSSTTKVYPIPNDTPNSIYGCLVIPSISLTKEMIGKHEMCQRVSYNLFIPEKTELIPNVSLAEIDQLVETSIHIFHPVFGCVSLEEELNWKQLIQQPEQKSFYVNKPSSSIFKPAGIKSFQINALSEEESMTKMETELFPQKQTISNKPLSGLEKGKLMIYKMLFQSNKKENGTSISNDDKLPGKLESFISKLLGGNNKLLDGLKSDFENLEERNKKELDRLMDMFKNNPKEALKYAIPLDSIGSSRGTSNSNASFNFLKRWNDFSLFSGSSPRYSSGPSIDLGDSFYTLQNQYNRTAEKLIEQEEYKEAAFIYLKLLQNNMKAAECMEKGKYYQEAATIHLRYTKLKNKAAECYEKGHMYNEAIQIYKELENLEKVGDLYLHLQKPDEAKIFYQKVVDECTAKYQFIKAADILKYKMLDPNGSQQKLLNGWKNNSEPVKCLTQYFADIQDEEDRLKEIKRIKEEDVKHINSIQFLQAICVEFKKQHNLSEPIKEIAYEVVGTEIKTQPGIIHELKSFNTENAGFIKDVIRFNQFK